MKKLVRLWKRPTFDGQKYTYYLVYYDADGRRKQKTLGHADKRKAEKQCAQLAKELRIDSVEIGSMRLSEFLADSLARTRGQVRENTTLEYDSTMRQFRPCEYTRKSHINFCVFDSTWEATESFHLGNNKNVKAWVKNDHLGFEVLYTFKGVVRKYRPDFVIKLKTGNFLVLEVKGRDSQEDKTKRAFLDEWVRAVNEKGGFGKWSYDVSLNPSDVADIISRHC